MNISITPNTVQCGLGFLSDPNERRTVDNLDVLELESDDPVAESVARARRVRAKKLRRAGGLSLFAGLLFIATCVAITGGAYLPDGLAVFSLLGIIPGVLALFAAQLIDPEVSNGSSTDFDLDELDADDADHLWNINPANLDFRNPSR